MGDKKKQNLIFRYKASSPIYNQRYSDIQSLKYRYIDSKINFSEFSLILDLGGGTGLFRFYLDSQVKLIMIDYSSDMLKQAFPSKSNDNKSMFILADVEYLPIRNMHIPLITGFSILQNLSNPISFLKDLLKSFPTSDLVMSGIKKSQKVNNIQNIFPKSTFTKETPRGIEDIFYIHKRQ